MGFRGMAVSLLVMGAAPAITVCGTAAYGAETFGFVGVDGSATDSAVGERQFFVEVIPTGTSETAFRFTNVGPTPSSMVGITFDDRGFDGELGPALDSLDDTTTRSAGVSFMAPAVAPDFPFPILGREFVLTSNMLVAANGINPGEALTVVATLESDADNDEVLERLESGQLQIGLLAEGFADGQTASFLNDTVPTFPPNVIPPIPSPAAVLLGALGVSLIGMLRRRSML